MSWDSISIDSWPRLIEIFSAFRFGDPLEYDHVFRGQADSSWSLTPSLLRFPNTLEFEEPDWHEIEQIFLRRFKSHAHQHLDVFTALKAGDCASWWSLMQHHRAPTRFLDWTASPYVAAYFAVNELPEKAGTIWVLHAQKLKTASREKFKEAAVLPTDSNQSDQFYFMKGAPRVLLLAEPTFYSDRMTAQQGLFTVSRQVTADHSELIEETFSANDPLMPFVRLDIGAEVKREIFTQLRGLNITASSLFPGMDGLGREIFERLKILQEA